VTGPRRPPAPPTTTPAALARGLFERRLGRRSFLEVVGLGAGLVGTAGLLGGCGIAGSASDARERRVNWADFWADQRPTSQLNFANWPLYIDSEDGKSESLALFTAATGIAVDYEPVIQGDEPFYATIEPELQAQESTGFDLAVITNGWQLTQLINDGFLVGLDHAKIPNFSKYASSLVKSPNYDPGNQYSVTWQTGFTGIAYNTNYIKREINSINDLADPAFKGYVGMMNDLTEVGSVALLRMGIDPATSTPKDWEASIPWLEEQRSLVLGYYDQSYISHLENGDTWISQAWSGDIFQANLTSKSPHLKFVVPIEGQMVWHDNMVILRQAANPLSALDWMNFYYTPKIAGIVEDWVNYVCPVPAAQSYIDTVLADPGVADSPLVFPTPAINAASRNYHVYKDYDDFQTWNDIYNPIIV
jgi:spermidine/putrescine transport system substrate-binding protein